MKTHFLFFLAYFMILSLFNGFGQTGCIIAHYPLDGNATDISGNSNDGTLYGTTLTTDHLGNPGSALYFNGTADKIVLPDDFDFQERTICLWLKTDTFKTGGQWAYDSDHASILYGHTQIYVEKYNGTNNISLGVGTNFIRHDSAKSTSWYHAAISVHLSYIKFYINGIAFDSIANNNFNHSADGDNEAKIGTTRKNDRFFQGSIDDVRIYDCALSDAEIIDLYVSVNELYDQAQNFKLYPNPSRNELTVEYSNSENNSSSSILIYNVNGQLLISAPVNSHKTIFDISGFSKGIYILKLINSDGVMVKKFVKD